MRISDILSITKNAKKFKKDMGFLVKSDSTLSGMSLPQFVKMIVKDPINTIHNMTDEEFKLLFEHEDISKLFLAMPKIKEIYEQEKVKRNISGKEMINDRL